MTRNVAVMMTVAALVLCSGCGRVLREGMGEVRGASGIVASVNPPSTEADPTQLAEYRAFVLGEIRDDIGGQLSPEFLPDLREAFAERLADKKLPNEPGGKTLVVRGTIIHYEDASTVGSVVSPLEEVICRTEFVDRSSGQVLAVANCVGRTTTSLNLGVKTKAEGLAKAMVSWIDKRYPKKGRENNNE